MGHSAAVSGQQHTATGDYESICRHYLRPVRYGRNRRTHKWKDDPVPNLRCVLLAQCCFLVLAVGCSPVPVCIEGEAGNQPQDTKVAIGEAIRNRGTLRGVYGCNTRQSPSRASKQAFKMSLTSNLTGGATHFLSKTDLKRPPKWLWAYKVTHKSGDFTFFKRKECRPWAVNCQRSPVRA
jgi:hypothetical protein